MFIFSYIIYSEIKPLVDGCKLIRHVRIFLTKKQFSMVYFISSLQKNENKEREREREREKKKKKFTHTYIYK